MCNRQRTTEFPPTALAQHSAAAGHMPSLWGRKCAPRLTTVPEPPGIESFLNEQKGGTSKKGFRMDRHHHLLLNKYELSLSLRIS